MIKVFMRVFIALFKPVAKHYTGRSITRDYKANEQVFLAVGKWEMYKHNRIPQFTIGLDKNAESVMFQVLRQYNPSTADLTITDKAIELCDKLAEECTTIHTYFDRIGIKFQ